MKPTLSLSSAAAPSTPALAVTITAAAAMRIFLMGFSGLLKGWTTNLEAHAPPNRALQVFIDPARRYFPAPQVRSSRRFSPAKSEQGQSPSPDKAATT